MPLPLASKATLPMRTRYGLALGAIEMSVAGRSASCDQGPLRTTPVLRRRSYYIITPSYLSVFCEARLTLDAQESSSCHSWTGKPPVMTWGHKVPRPASDPHGRKGKGDLTVLSAWGHTLSRLTLRTASLVGLKLSADSWKQQRTYGSARWPTSQV